MYGQQRVLACDLNAIPVNERDAHTRTSKQVFGAVEAVSEFPDGYGFRLPVESELLRAVADFIANERLCCPFYRFEVIIEPEGAALWLHLRGGDDVKALLRVDIGGYLPVTVAQAAGLA